MKSAIYEKKTVECYQDTDLANEQFIAICEQARELWEQRCKEYVEKHGEQGTCVIGAGFTVWYLPPRARKPQQKMILRSPLCLQGSLTWEHSKNEIERVFRNAGIDVNYEWGSMD